MGENTTTTIIAVLAAMALLIFTDVRAIHITIKITICHTTDDLWGM